MKVTSTRFGSVEIAEEDVLEFPKGILGFSNLRRFALLPHRSSTSVAWLQSLDSPEIALPVVSAHALEAGYEGAMTRLELNELGVSDPNDIAALLVLSVTPGLPPTVNGKAPILVDAATRKGVQVVLQETRFSTRDPLVLSSEDLILADATAA